MKLTANKFLPAAAILISITAFLPGNNPCRPIGVNAASATYLETQLTARDTVISDRFGTSVSIDGNLAVAGADTKESAQGAVYVFNLSDTGWRQQAKLTAGDAASGDHFGASVAISGNTIVVGAYGKSENKGAVYVFSYDGSTWVQQARLTGSDSISGDYFGCSVAISGDTIIAGAYGKSENKGSAYIFIRSGNTWGEQTILKPDNPAAGDCFGQSVDIDSNTAIIGAPGKMNHTGAAYIFTRSGTSWIQQGQLSAGDAAPEYNFGCSVSISQDTAIAGAWQASSLKGTTGAAYIFTRSNTVWSQQSKLISIDPESFDRFGISVAIDGDTAMIGADWKYGGAAYMFKRSAYGWTQINKFSQSDGITGDLFGTAVAISQETALVGAPARYNKLGAAYIYSQMKPLSIDIAAATAVQTTSAILNAKLISLGTAESVSAYFEYGTTPAYGSVTTTQTLTTAGPFSAPLTDLTPYTTYHFRVRADGGPAGIVYSTDMTFTTAAIPPAIEIPSATAVQTTSATLNGNLISPGSAEGVGVYFEYGTTTAYGSVTATQTLTTVGPFSATLTNLTPNTTYHFRAVADGGQTSKIYSIDRTFITLALPLSVDISQATAVQTASATLNGKLNSTGTAATVKVYFEYGTTTGYGNLTPTLILSAAGPFNASISGLKPGSIYHFRAVADGGPAGIVYSTDMTFTTAAIPPAIEIPSATTVQTTSATLNGNLISPGSAEGVGVYFEYGTTTAYGSVTTTQTLTTAGPFSATLTNLTPNTTYHFRAVADGGPAGIVYSPDMTFTTTAIPPAIEISPATAVQTTSATLNGNLISPGTAESVSVYFEYGTTPAYGSVTAAQILTTASPFSATLTDLTPDTTYHFRAVADGGPAGIVYSPDTTLVTSRSSSFIWLPLIIIGVLVVAGSIIFIIRRRNRSYQNRIKAWHKTGTETRGENAPKQDDDQEKMQPPSQL